MAAKPHAAISSSAVRPSARNSDGSVMYPPSVNGISRWPPLPCPDPPGFPPLEPKPPPLPGRRWRSARSRPSPPAIALIPRTAGPGLSPPGRPACSRRTARPRSSSSSALSLGPCPRRGPESLRDGFRSLAGQLERAQPVRRLAPARWRRPTPSRSTSATRSAGSKEPRPAPGALPRRQVACARDGRAKPSRQLPRMRQRSDRGMSQGGWTAVRLGRYLRITVLAVVDVGRA
jgi:hypothetical protein